MSNNIRVEGRKSLWKMGIRSIMRVVYTIALSICVRDLPRDEQCTAAAAGLADVRHAGQKVFVVGGGRTRRPAVVESSRDGKEVSPPRQGRRGGCVQPAAVYLLHEPVARTVGWSGRRIRSAEACNSRTRTRDSLPREPHAERRTSLTFPRPLRPPRNVQMD